MPDMPLTSAITFSPIHGGFPVKRIGSMPWFARPKAWAIRAISNTYDEFSPELWRLLQRKKGHH